MLPHVDSFRPIHNLAAMADLCAALSPDARQAGDPRAQPGQRIAPALDAGHAGIAHAAARAVQAAQGFGQAEEGRAERLLEQGGLHRRAGTGNGRKA